MRFENHQKSDGNKYKKQLQKIAEGNRDDSAKK